MPRVSAKPWHIVRLSMVLCWGLWLATFFITVTLLQAVLEVHVVAQVTPDAKKGYFSFSKEFVQTAPLDVLSAAEQQKIEEMLIRYYLEMRYTRIPDVMEMTNRWGARLAYLTTTDVYRKAKLDPEKAAKQQPQVVDIRSLVLEEQRNTYQALIDLYEFDGERSWIKTTKSLYISFVYIPSRAGLGNVFSNPRGLLITGVDERGSK